MLVDLAARNITGDVAAALERAGLAVNKNLIPFDPRPPEAPSGLRLSSNAGTTRGFGVSEFRTIGSWIDRVLADPTDTMAIAAISSGKIVALQKHGDRDAALVQGCDILRPSGLGHDVEGGRHRRDADLMIEADEEIGGSRLGGFCGDEL